MPSDAQKKPQFSLAHQDPRLVELIETTDHKTLGVWALGCAEHVLKYFEVEYPSDLRPRRALEALRRWIDTGEFRMAIVRKASLDSHAAARAVGTDNPARSAARAAGQAVATAHVRTHAMGAAIYAVQAIYRATEAEHTEAAIDKERDWQYRRLLELSKG